MGNVACMDGYEAPRIRRASRETLQMLARCMGVHLRPIARVPLLGSWWLRRQIVMATRDSHSLGYLEYRMAELGVWACEARVVGPGLVQVLAVAPWDRSMRPRDRAQRLLDNRAACSVAVGVDVTVELRSVWWGLWLRLRRWIRGV